jgi:hypothetical protein
MMTPATLARLAKRRFGPHWQVPLAKAIKVSTGAISHWATGRRTIRPIVEAAIRQACAPGKQKRPRNRSRGLKGGTN